MRSGSRPSLEGTRLMFAGDTVLWCVQLMDSTTTKKARRTQPRWRQRQSRKKRESRPQRGGGFSLNLDFVPGVSRWSGGCGIARYIAIYRDIISRIMRYHKIPGTVYRDIASYLYHEVLGLISRYRIPSIYFSIPNTIFRLLGAPSLVH